MTVVVEVMKVRLRENRDALDREERKSRGLHEENENNLLKRAKGVQEAREVSDRVREKVEVGWFTRL